MGKLSLEAMKFEFPILDEEISKRVLGGTGYTDVPPHGDNSGIYEGPILPADGDDDRDDTDDPINIPDPLDDGSLDNDDPDLPDNLDGVDPPDNGGDDDRGDEEDGDREDEDDDGYTEGDPDHDSDPEGDPSGDDDRWNDDREEEWDTSDFFDHYNNGEGQPVDLKDIGFEDEIRGSDTYEGIRERFGNQIENTIRENAVGKEKGASYEIKEDFDNTYNFTFDAVEIGGATIRGNFQGTYSIDNAGDVSWEGNADIEFFDEFKDPWDLFNTFEQDFETGTPFDINGSWTEQYGGKF